MRAKVSFLTRPVKEGEEKPRTVLNPSALMTNGVRNTVFVVQGNRVMETPVTLGPPLGDMVEVLTGVKAGDRVVIRPSKRLRNDSRIKILEK
jgi:multidrug efflux pump subunit AcrA (membrane-fusion protein)